MRAFFFFAFTLFSLLSSYASPPLKIKFSLDWMAQAEHGGFYQAQALGLYEKAGLDVEIKAGGPGTDPQILIATKTRDIVIGSNSFSSLNLIQAGVPAVAVAAIFQKDPQMIMLHADHPAQKLADLKNQPIMVSDNTIGTTWKWLSQSFGFNQKQIRKKGLSIAPFLADPRAAQQGYISSEPFAAEQAGIPVKSFLLADAGYPSYANLILVRQEFLDQHPEAVKKFVLASIEGWKSYLSQNPKPAHDLILKDNSAISLAQLNYSRQKIIDYALCGDIQHIGAMSPERWKKFFDLMVSLGIYSGNLAYEKAFKVLP